MNNELLYNQLYERTKDFGRTQFIKEIMRLERENNNLKKMVIHKHKYASEMEGKYILEKFKLDQLRSQLEKRLDDENDIFSVVRVKDVLFKLNELENKDE